MRRIDTFIPTTPAMISTSIYRRLLTSRWTSFTQPKIKPLYRNFAVSASDTALTIHGTPFPFGWLRDSCQCPSCINPSTYHKLHKTSDIPVNIKPKSQGIRATNEGVHIEWITGHQSFYPTPFLERHSSPEKLSRAHQEVRQIAWDSSSLSKAQSLYLPYESLQSPSGLLVAINQLTQFGLLFVTGVPNEESSDATCELRKLAQLFGEIRSTFYGEMFDVKNLRNSTNVAYTNLNLGFHMDLLYVFTFVSEFLLKSMQVFRTSSSISNSSLPTQSRLGRNINVRRCTTSGVHTPHYEHRCFQHTYIHACCIPPYSCRPSFALLTSHH